MIRPNQHETQLMRKRYQAPIKKWVVYYCGVVAYENADIKLCWYFIRMHSLNVKPTPIR